MHSIQDLFDITKCDNDVSKKHKKRMGRACKHIKDYKLFIPEVSYPEANSKDFLKDIDSVRFYFKNPCLTDNFLNLSDKSVEDCFKEFCIDAGVELDWKHINQVLKDVDTIILKMKYQHKRPRPRFYLESESEIFQNIKKNKSYSFPSGHTTMAYFVAGILSDAYPNLKPDFVTMAELIGQSRIDNGVHFPSDVSAGKLIGQTLSNLYTNNQKEDIRNLKLEKKDSKNFGKFLIQKSKNVKKDIIDFANYLYQTNSIENYIIPYEECLKTSEKVFQGYPVAYVTNNNFLQTIIASLVCAYKINKIDSPYKIIGLHLKMNKNCLERGNPGEIRYYPHYSPAGHEYVGFDDIYKELEVFTSQNFNNPFLKHAYFEHIHPFCDGNGRIGRVILCHDLNYNFEEVNKLIDSSYLKNINKYFSMFRI